jgi:hypothetical protein
MTGKTGRNWVGTLHYHFTNEQKNVQSLDEYFNNPFTESIKKNLRDVQIEICERLKKLASFNCFLGGYHIGKKSKILHMHIMVEFTSSVAMTTVKKVIQDNTAHLEQRKGSYEDCKKYLGIEATAEWIEDLPQFVDGEVNRERAVFKKKLSCVPDILVIGEPKENGKHKTNLQDLKNAIDEGATKAELWENYFGLMSVRHKAVDQYMLIKRKTMNRDVKVFNYYGSTGSGKTYRAFEMFGKDAYILHKSPYNNIWFDGYDGEKVLIIDDFKGWMEYSQLLRILDQYPLQVDVRGGKVWANWEKVVITSSKPVQQWYT